MKLFYNPPSPDARKVLVLAHEFALLDRLILIPVDPWKDPPDLIAATPLAKVPALVTGAGVSRVFGGANMTFCLCSKFHPVGAGICFTISPGPD